MVLTVGMLVGGATRIILVSGGGRGARTIAKQRLQIDLWVKGALPESHRDRKL